ncbi:hypothetical protein BTVI_38842 [Pitangus sulphuratus]|nr:hypothetical protein BTVI_38842 [Pitangus sulphuratus]
MNESTVDTMCAWSTEEGEDMKKWDGEPTSKLEAQVREIRRKKANKNVIHLVDAEASRKNQRPLRCKKTEIKDDDTSDGAMQRMIGELESQGVVSKTHSPFNSPIWPVRKSDGGWRLTVDYRGLNEVTMPLSASVPEMLELQYELESKAAR